MKKSLWKTFPSFTTSQIAKIQGFRYNFISTGTNISDAMVLQIRYSDGSSSSTTVTNHIVTDQICLRLNRTSKAGHPEQWWNQKTLAASYLYDKKCSFIRQGIIFIQDVNAIKDDFRT